MNDIADQLENLSPPDGLGTRTVSDTHALTSIAISLKRIADFLDFVKADDAERKGKRASA